MSELLLKPWMLMLVLVALIAGVQVWVSHLRYEMSLDTQRLQAEKQEIMKRAGLLRLELASMTRPERLREIAIGQLDMSPPTPMQVVHP